MSPSATGLKYTIRVMDGGMTLGLTAQSLPEDVSPEALVDLLVDQLEKRNVAFGIERAALERMARERITGEEVTVAHGQPPRPGKDADLELLLTPPSFVAQTGQDGRVDYRNVQNVSAVKAGDVISRKIPADPGEPGVNVFGKPVRPPMTQDARHPAGRNTAISADGLELTAAVDGFLRWNEHKIDVLKLYTVTGDVDLRTGNVRYERDVEVWGDVKAGFEVLAGGSVRVYGSVEGGKVVSEGGTVTVEGGVMGNEANPAMIAAVGDILIGRARFARIESQAGRVIANMAVEHSDIRAAGDLILRAGPAMNCVVQVGGKVDAATVSNRTPLGQRGALLTASASHTGGNRREYLRVTLSPAAPAHVHGDKPSDVWQASVLDLSAGGARVRMAEARLQELNRHRVQFTLEGVPGTLWMDAQVVRTCDASHQGRGGSYGLRFTQIEPAVREAIARFCLAEDLRQHRAAKSP